MNNKRLSLFFIITSLTFTGFIFQNCSSSERDNQSTAQTLEGVGGELVVRYEFLSEPRVKSNVMILATATGGSGIYKFEFIKNGASFSSERVTVVHHSGENNIYQIKVIDTEGEESTKAIEFPDSGDSLNLKFSIFPKGDRSIEINDNLIVLEEPIELDFTLESTSGQVIDFLSEHYWQEGKPEIINGQYKMVWRASGDPQSNFLIEPGQEKTRYLRAIASDPRNPTLKFSSPLLVIKNSYIDNYDDQSFLLEDSSYEFLPPYLRSFSCPHPYFISSVKLKNNSDNPSVVNMEVTGLKCIRQFDKASKEIKYTKTDANQYIYYSSPNDITGSMNTANCDDYTQDKENSIFGLVSIDLNRDHACAEVNLDSNYELTNIEEIENTNAINENEIEISCPSGKFATALFYDVRTFITRSIVSKISCGNLAEKIEVTE